MRIFISYAARDEELASQLADQLSQAGFAVWDAAKELAPGDNWAKEMGRALDESDLMVAVITPGALQSRFLEGEIQYALTSKRFEHRLVPVFVGYSTVQVGKDTGKDVPWILLKMNPVHTDQSRGFGEVVDRVREIARQETNAPC
jgi:hypothetical protein